MARGSPFDELERLVERLDEAREGRSGGLAVDVEGAGDAFEVTADLPGFEKDDIDVEVQDRTVRVAADHEEEAAESDEDYVRKERTKRSVSRSVTLPEAVEESAASATFTNGVLTVTLPKVHAGGESTSVDIE
ncbi:MAG: Hsp20/alpha crystallin family protein [Halobacterium sp.]